MINCYTRIACLICLVGLLRANLFLGDECILHSSDLEGICKLLNNCPKVVDEFRNHRRNPQICGFYGSESVVCCPSEETRKPGEISKQKCKEYSEYVKETFIPPVGIINATAVTTNECGHKATTLIVGGEKASRKEFPHMAAIGYGSSIENAIWRCGGTILSDKYILTAAHCFHHREFGKPRWVKLGVTKLSSRVRRQHIEIGRLITHPDYKSSSNYNDIGLVELKESAKLNPYARPACLHQKQEISANKVIATGWGQTGFTEDSSNDLLKTSLNIFDGSECEKSIKVKRKILQGILDGIQICAGSVDRRNDSCLGDSGGPLQIYHTDDDIECMYDIVGITSFGMGCYGAPGVYTRVSHYIKWLEDIVWP